MAYNQHTISCDSHILETVDATVRKNKVWKWNILGGKKEPLWTNLHTSSLGRFCILFWLTEGTAQQDASTYLDVALNLQSSQNLKKKIYLCPTFPWEPPATGLSVSC